VLRIANSAFYGLAQEVYSVRDAIIVIGFEAVRSLAISAAVVTGVWVEDEYFDNKSFWVHSLGCGIFAELIAKKLRYAKPDAAFTIGVLHDIGRVIILQTIPDKYREVMITSQSDHSYLWQAERKVLGFHHGDVGARLIAKWKLPIEFEGAIHYHHEADKAGTASLLAHIIALADALSYNVQLTGKEMRITQPLYKGLWEPLGLSNDEVRDIRNQADVIKERTLVFYTTVTS
jgi:putative nucleotidyltransferase with HDIG domain